MKKCRSCIIALLTIALFCISISFALPATKITPEQQANSLIEKQLFVIAMQVLKDFPQDIQLAKFAVEFYNQCERPDKAMATLEQALKYNPKSYELCNTIAKTAFDNGTYDKAITYWTKALTISPEKLELNNNIAETYMALGKYAEAVKQLEKIINKETGKALPSLDYSRSYFLLGQGYLQLKQYEKAKEYLEKALVITPDHRIGHYQLAKTYIRLKKPEKAKHHMELYKKQKTETANRKEEWAKKRKTAIINNTVNEDRDVFSRTLTRLSAHGSRLYLIAGNIQSSQELLDKAETIFQKAIAIDPKQSVMYRQFALLYVMTNRKLDKARDLVKKAAELEPSAQNYFMLGRIYYQNLDQPNALITIEKAIKLEPGNPLYRRTYNKIKKETDK